MYLHADDHGIVQVKPHARGARGSCHTDLHLHEYASGARVDAARASETCDSNRATRPFNASWRAVARAIEWCCYDFWMRSGLST